jgi:hypothetical protein
MVLLRIIGVIVLKLKIILALDRPELKEKVVNCSDIQQQV